MKHQSQWEQLGNGRITTGQPTRHQPSGPARFTQNGWITIDVPVPEKFLLIPWWVTAIIVIAFLIFVFAW